MARKPTKKSTKKPAKKDPKKDDNEYKSVDKRTFRKDGEPNKDAKDTPQNGVAKIEKPKELTIDDIVGHTFLEQREVALGTSNQLSKYVENYFQNNGGKHFVLSDEKQKTAFAGEFCEQVFDSFFERWYNLKENAKPVAGNYKEIVRRAVEDGEALYKDMIDGKVDRRLYNFVMELDEDLEEATGLNLMKLKESLTKSKDPLDLKVIRGLIAKLEGKLEGHVLNKKPRQLKTVFNKENLDKYRTQLMEIAKRHKVDLQVEDLATPFAMTNVIGQFLPDLTKADGPDYMKNLYQGKNQGETLYQG